ncbi:hypothetical protein Q7C36_014934 [Tachysurus vachellii]|uniref:Uncharacterized protein n=1 Tax=Tachysurus vachellii TaxID=175792 RepID=A0AA88MAJ8_TACVA|nr:hypothetical protein Q7C36_014934 [Tachysurus vachellii]
MSTEENSRLQRQKVPKAKLKAKSKRTLKTKLVISKAFLSFPVGPKTSETCLSRQTDAMQSFRSGSSVKIQKTRSVTLGSSHNKDTSVYTQGPLKNAPAGRKEKGTCEVKQNVLRTISRMLQENRTIREQRIGLSQNQEAEPVPV